MQTQPWITLSTFLCIPETQSHYKNTKSQLFFFFTIIKRKLSGANVLKAVRRM